VIRRPGVPRTHWSRFVHATPCLACASRRTTDAAAMVRTSAVHPQRSIMNTRSPCIAIASHTQNRTLCARHLFRPRHEHVSNRPRRPSTRLCSTHARYNPRKSLDYTPWRCIRKNESRLQAAVAWWLDLNTRRKYHQIFKRNHRTSPLYRLPNEMLKQIAKYLPFTDVMTLVRTCRHTAISQRRRRFN
jgi:hypothetical protein